MLSLKSTAKLWGLSLAVLLSLTLPHTLEAKEWQPTKNTPTYCKYNNNHKGYYYIPQKDSTRMRIYYCPCEIIKDFVTFLPGGIGGSTGLAGNRHYNLYLDAEETQEECKKLGIPYKLPISNIPYPVPGIYLRENIIVSPELEKQNVNPNYKPKPAAEEKQSPKPAKKKAPIKFI